MSSLRCIVVDDEPLACRLIASYVERTDGLELCGSYTSALQALDAINKENPDIAFLDIQMPELTGLDIARRITAQTKVVFTTAYRDFAVEGFQVNAIHYLLKPISYAEFLQAVERASASRSEQQQFISVKSEYRLIRIPVNDILYIEGLKDYIKIFIDGQPRPVLTLMSMKAIEATLPNDSFMRVHRSYIANTDRIRVLEQGRIVYGDARIPVSDSCKTLLLERIKNQ
ncbi:MAG: LytTR family DNA-binding domain-containing protein [Muribaculaceae bacterium]|nr:LytTR family DNA-binding domain-containing protein [Muribaculaceae bacterium]